MEEELRYYGLSEKEIKVFLANLKLGPATASTIAIESDLRRSTAYEILESLKSKGLVSVFIKSKKYYFEAAQPSRLVSLLREKEQRIISILPALEELNKLVVEKPATELYIGKEGVKTIFEDILRVGEEVLGFSSLDVHERLPFFFPNYIKRRVELNIPTKLIAARSKLTEEHKKDGKKDKREIRFIKQDFKSSVFIYGNKVALITLAEEEMMGVLVTSKQIVETQRQLFNNIWSTLAP